MIILTYHSEEGPFHNNNYSQVYQQRKCVQITYQTNAKTITMITTDKLLQWLDLADIVD